MTVGNHPLEEEELAGDSPSGKCKCALEENPLTAPPTVSLHNIVFIISNFGTLLRVRLKAMERVLMGV